MTAGLEIQASTGLSALPISPWAGLGVLAAWAAAALLNLTRCCRLGNCGHHDRATALGRPVSRASVRLSHGPVIDPGVNRSRCPRASSR
jgi:hypothetical protein